MTRTPKNASSTSSGTTTRPERSRSSRSEETTNPTAPPPSRSGVVSPRTGSGLPLAMWTMPRTPKQNADQPITWRPAGPLCTGSRITRQPARTTTSGTSQPTLPTEPVTTVRTNSMSPPGASNHTAAADDDGDAEQEQAGAVAAVLGIQVAGGVPDAARRRADCVGDAEPDGGHPPEQRLEGARPDRCRCARHAARAGGPASWPRAGRAFLLGFRALRDRVLEPPRPLPADVLRTWTRTCSCSANPAGKTYGSPW